MPDKINKNAFSLIELIITIFIISVLAAIAIPNYLHFQLKAKTSEARLNLGGIKICQELFRNEHGFYAVCSMNPGFFSIGGKQPWMLPVSGDGWIEIGFQPSGSLYYTYEVSVGGIFAPAFPANRGGIPAPKLADNMCIGVAGDLDGNGVNGEFGFSTSIGAISTTGNIVGTVTAESIIQDITPREF